MCRIISMSSLCDTAREVASQYGGYGLVADQIENVVREATDVEEEAAPLVREIPNPVQVRGLW